MKTIVFLVALATTAALWWGERLASARLEIDLQARKAEAHDAVVARREQDRLRALQPSDAELKVLRRAGSEHARFKAALAAEAATAPTSSAKLDLGDWRPATSWRNRGQATPTAALETALWAAAGGDIETLKNLLSIGADTRQKAEGLLARLPADARARYATVEDLIAEMTVKNVPLGAAQLVWFNQQSEDAATACVFLDKQSTPAIPSGGLVAGLPPETVAAAAAAPPPVITPAMRAAAIARAAQLKAERAAHPELRAPSGPDNSRGIETYLALQRDGASWRLVVPPSAIDGFAKELNLQPPLPVP